MFQQDMIKRAIEQLAAAVARVLGLVQAQDNEQALLAAKEAKRALPLVPGMIDTLPASGLFRLLGEHQSGPLVELFLAEAQALEALGRTPEATKLRAKAHALDTLVKSTSGAV